MKLSRKEAVERYGNETEKSHFNRYGTITSTNVEDALITTIKQHFDFFRRVKQGREIFYIMSREKTEISERPDNRRTNGNWKPYTHNMDILILQSLLSLQQNDDVSLSQLARYLGVINQKVYYLLKGRFDEGIVIKITKDISKNNILNANDKGIIDDYLLLSNTLLIQFSGALNRLQKENLITYSNGYEACLKDGTYKKLNLATYNILETKKKILMEKYTLDYFKIITLRNSEKVKSYNKEWKKLLNKVPDENGEIISIDYYYKTYLVILNKSINPICRYLNQYKKNWVSKFNLNQGKFLENNRISFFNNVKKYFLDESMRKQQLTIQKADITYLNNLNKLERETGLEETTLDEHLHKQGIKMRDKHRINSDYLMKMESIHDYLFTL
ncbi:MAG: hypothetical protein K0Q97_2049 [Bacillota bacterium]|jgi:DNA-binding Lrp family transcriptional regulator|nr:hypothetical protein [Bacillota bacterium]